ncbi:MAG: hypothetical protein NTV62_03375 [Candidatus Gribaldobacteria bacterium]|nr:hypothetical protein [Candidatus Gribaldobacteria bacterium]
MITPYKNLFKVIAMLAIVSIIAPAILVQARAVVGENNSTTTPKANNNQAFCDKILQLGENFSQKVAQEELKLEEERDKKIQLADDHRGEIDQKRSQNRASWSENRLEQFAKIEERAQTDAQKQAVIKFREAVSTAIADRQSKVDTAVTIFRKGMDDALSTRKSTVDEAVKAFRQKVGAIYAKAKTDCETGVAVNTIRNDVKQGIKTAQDNYKTARGKIDKKAEAVKSLTEAKKKALEKAMEEFRIMLEKAKKDLKVAFPKTEKTATSTNPTTTPSE